MYQVTLIYVARFFSFFGEWHTFHMVPRNHQGRHITDYLFFLSDWQGRRGKR